MTEKPTTETEKDDPTLDEKPEKPSFLKKLKETLEHGKAAATAIILLVTVVMTIYQHFRPEKEARTSYETLKPVVEDTANDVHDLKARMEYMEKLLMLQGMSPKVVMMPPPTMAEGEPEEDVTPADAGSVSAAPHKIDSLPDRPRVLAPSVIMPKKAVVLPDAPWEQRELQAPKR